MSKQTHYRKGTYWRRPGGPVIRIDGTAGGGFVNVSRCSAGTFNTEHEWWESCLSAWLYSEFAGHTQVTRRPTA